jgi:5-methylcytosine-specific restriction endonuclease McrA
VCRKELLATTEYFHKNKTGKYGLKSTCKKCSSEYKKQYKINNAEKIRQSSKIYCQKNTEKIKQSSKQYRLINAQKIREHGKKYYQNNKSLCCEKRREYYRSNKDKKSLYYKNNIERIRTARKLYRKENLEYFKEYNKNYLNNNRDKFRNASQMRYARKKNLPANYTAEQWEEAKRYFNNKCAYCGKEKPLTQDHFVPLSKGGEYTINNIVPACGKCNSSKKECEFSAWYPKQEFYSKKREQKVLKYLNYYDGTQQLKIV